MPNRHASLVPSSLTQIASRAKSVAASAPRHTHIDTLRGLLLVLMAVNHIPSDLHAVTDHPFGFMSAAEGFVFMAGLMAGYVYTRKWLRGNFRELFHACTSRTVTIYRWHALALILVFSGLVSIGYLTGTLPLNTPAATLDLPALSFVSALLLIHQPTLFDVLPMYCVLLLATPWLLRICARPGGYTRLICGSLSLWAAANIFCPQTPFEYGVINTGAFNLAAWQLLYVTALAFGHRWATRQQTHSPNNSAHPQHLLARPSTAVLLGLSAIAALLFCVRHGFIPSGLSETSLAAVTNKNNLAPIRLLDTALIIYLSYQLISRHPRAFSWRPLAWIGRASLPVFSIHILAAYAIHAFPQTFAETSSGRWLGTALMLATLMATAAIHSARDRHRLPASPPLERPAPALQTRHPRARRHIVRHEPRPPLPADSFHR
ncbi:hypothetical protein CMV30_15815 [Nibricoccus aquaticus]|uniref:OpgC protein n=1 Tax=Nibricoccus aquaticus TaxID=2576891 RepID=A0A290QG91_9BACT|nr:OpgC domain-containing protein [Nibricoccus aquaticus]ATC65296.1 hypothetical protein CMV30_15815 [Nibricoccus aquaticus]